MTSAQVLKALGAEARGIVRDGETMLAAIQPTTGCCRYGCWINPRTGRCNRCGA